VARPRVAEIEAKNLLDLDPKLSTLVRYLTAVGLELEVRARGPRGASYRLAGPAQQMAPPTAIELSPDLEAEARAILAEEDA